MSSVMEWFSGRYFNSSTHWSCIHRDLQLTHRSAPWIGQTPVEAGFMVLGGNRLPIKEGVQSILVDIMKLCWLQDPQQRPSFKQICQMLKKHLQHEESVELVKLASRAEYQLSPNENDDVRPTLPNNYVRSPIQDDKPKYHQFQSPDST